MLPSSLAASGVEGSAGTRFSETGSETSGRSVRVKCVNKTALFIPARQNSVAPLPSYVASALECKRMNCFLEDCSSAYSCFVVQLVVLLSGAVCHNAIVWAFQTIFSHRVLTRNNFLLSKPIDATAVTPHQLIDQSSLGKVMFMGRWPRDKL